VRIFGLFFVSVFSLSLLFAGQPVQADLHNSLIRGAIGAIIQNEINKNNRNTRPSQNTRTTKPRVVNPAQAAEPRMSRDTRQQVQAALNLQGYGAGIEDGVLGRGTRAAIQRYQSANGYAATGYLTPNQLGQLRSVYSAALANGNPNLSRPLTKAEMKELQAYLRDLGYYSSTIDGIAGRGTALAISNFLKGQSRDPNATTTAETLKLARAAATGTGPSTIPALNSNVLASGTPSPDSVATGSTPVPSTDALAGYFPGYTDDGQRMTLSEALSRRIIKERPDLLDSDARVAKWIEKTMPRRQFASGKPKANKETTRFYSGIPLEREAAIEALRPQVAAMAISGPLKFKAANIVALQYDQFDPTRGIPITLGGGRGETPDPGAILKRGEFRADELSTKVKFAFETIPDVNYLPVSAERAVEIQRLHQESSLYQLRLIRYITATSVATEIVDDGWGQTYFGGGTVDFVELAMTDKNTGTVIESLNVWKTPEPGDSSELIRVANWLDVPIVNGHALHTGGRFYFGKSLYGGKKKIGQRWRNLAFLSAFKVQPALFDNGEVALNLAKVALNDQQRYNLADGTELFASLGGGLRNLTEFKRREIESRLANEFREPMLSRLPNGPIPIVDVREVTLGEYNFDTEAFPFLESGLSDPLRFIDPYNSMNGMGVPGVAVTRVKSPLKSLPAKIEVSLSEAEEFAASLTKGNSGPRLAYLGHFGSLQEFRAGQGSVVEIVVESTRLALFADPGLSILLKEYDVPTLASERASAEADRIATEAEALRKEQEADQDRANEITALQQRIEAANAYANELDLSVLGVHLGMEKDEAIATLLEEQPAFSDTMTGNPEHFGASGRFGEDGCGSFVYRLYRDATAGQPVTDDIPPDVLAKLPIQCWPQHLPLGMGFQANAEIAGGKLNDTIMVFIGQSGEAKGRVVAVLRDLELDGLDVDVFARTQDRYGAPNFVRGDDHLFWSKSGEQAINAESDTDLADRCFPKFVGNKVTPGNDLRIDGPAIDPECSVRMGIWKSGDRYFLHLVDPGYVNVSRAMYEAAIAGDKPDEDVEIKF